jgi:uncharacterized membrane protein
LYYVGTACILSTVPLRMRLHELARARTRASDAL